MDRMYVSLWKRAALCLACFGMTIPQGALVAAEKPEQVQASRMLDVKLTDGGKLTGQLVDTQGNALKGATVTVRFHNQVVAVAKTNNAGRIAVTGLMGGTHQLETEHGRINARLWTAQTAPPSAKPNALIVSEKNIIRAQCGEAGCGVGGGAGLFGHGGHAGVVGGGVVGNGGWVSGNAYGDGFYGGGYDPYCYDYGYADGGAGGFGGGFLGGGALTALTIAGVITAIAIAADDDDNRRSSP
ncbi:MAG: hypothetical protein AB8G99_06045 [Planctomycetaceae bacterium]